jgi:hypothetical protein
MASRIEEHLQQWQHNRAFLPQISLRFRDWIVTAALYLAIHAIEAVLTADGARARSRHRDRLEILQREKRYERINKSFHVLYNLAHVTRYSATPSRWVPADQIEQRILRDLVYPIDSVRKLLAASKPPITMPEVPAIVLRTDET